MNCNVNGKHQVFSINYFYNYLINYKWALKSPQPEQEGLPKKILLFGNFDCGSRSDGELFSTVSHFY